MQISAQYKEELSNSPGTRKRKEVEAPIARESRQRCYPGGEDPLRRLLSEATAQIAGGQSPAFLVQHPKCKGDPGPVPPPAGAGQG